MSDFQPDPSAGYLVCGAILLVLGQGLVVIGILTVPWPALLGVVVMLGGLIALVAGIHNLASSVDYLARRASEKHRVNA